ncbi:hypothetical protein [Nocardia sp. NBC_00416]|uniref:hypothetical protein n=1 Tax=Nocardia sp. NBC_00416 TaxID=2975991 RepID=UPI002E1CE4E4
MDRPPSGPPGGEWYRGDEDSGGSPHPPDPGYTDPDPHSRRPDLYTPQYDPADLSVAPDEAMPTEPIPVLRLPGWDSGNATYEGSWSDWVARANEDSAAPVRDREPHPGATAYADPPEADIPHTDSPAPDSADSTPAGARERLRRRLTPPDPAAPAPDRSTESAPGRNRWVPALLGIAGAGALGAAAYVQFAVVGGDEAHPPAAAAPSATAPATAVPDQNCPAERVGNTVQGNDPGGADSGPAAIFGFQHAYYVTRSGEQARALVAPDAAVPSAADIQRGIDTIPIGTTHCVRIAPGAFVGQYTVSITEYQPGSAPLSYNPQLVTAMRIGDRTLITGIGPMP